MKCGVIQFKFATPPLLPSLATHTRRNLSPMTSMQLRLHHIISYICHPTDVRAPAASYILFMTIPIICLCADLSVTVAPLLHIVRSTPRTIHHLLYYCELCISLVYETCMRVCGLTSWMCRSRQRNADRRLCHILLTLVHFVVIIDSEVLLPEDMQTDIVY